MAMKGRILAVLAGAAIVAGVAVSAAFGAQRARRDHRHIGLDRRDLPAHRAGIALQDDSRGGEGVLRLRQRQRRRQRAQDRLQVLDDGYDPSKTVPLTQQLVEQDKVFAVFGSLGTAPNLAPGAT